MKELRDNQRCFVCGRDNPAGLGVDFEIDRERRSISAKFTPSDIYQGYEGIVHGGILSTLLDEAMAKLTVGLGMPAVTAEMTVTFKAPAAPGEDLFVSGRLTHETRRLIRAEAKIERGPVVIAKATGKLLRVSS
ncbi:MAG: PaaI family thioesterase [Nitrospirota bacterium]